MLKIAYFTSSSPPESNVYMQAMKAVFTAASASMQEQKKKKKKR